MTGVFTNQNGEWHYIHAPQVNVDDVWCLCKAVFVKAEGEWHRVWQRDANVLTLPVRRVPIYKEIHDVRSCAA